MLHGVVFALIGVLIAYLIAAAQRRPALHLVLFIGLGCFEVAFLAVIARLAPALFHGLRHVHALQITLPLIGEYTLVHGAAFLAFGWVAAVLLDRADREPRLLFLFVLLFCCFEVFFVALVAITAEWLLESLAWWTILLGNLLAALTMLAFFFREHRVAWRRFLSARE